MYKGFVYKKEDIILESPHTMITSTVDPDDIIVVIYTRYNENDPWVVADDFRLTLKAFKNISDNMSFLVAAYVRQVFGMGA